MEGRVLNIGFGNVVFTNRVIAIMGPESAPIKRLLMEAKDRGRLIDGTAGRRTRAVIITDSEYIILSAIQPYTVASRLGAKDLEDDCEE